jgi:hypothetical protein
MSDPRPGEPRSADPRALAGGERRCAACGRPIASSQPRCLYCGSALPERAAAVAVVETPGPEPTGVVVVIDTAPGPPALAAALGLPLAEATQRCRRDRYLLHRILGTAEADAEAWRLAQRGLDVILLSESALRTACHPWVARGGDPETGVFVLESTGDTKRVAGADVLAIIWGVVRREHTLRDKGPLRGQRYTTGDKSEEEPIVHVHTRADARPVEVSPSAFQFSQGRSGFESSVLRVRRSLELLAPSVVVDRSFALETPALGASADPSRGSLSIAESLRSSADRAPAKRSSASALDNLTQFRFHSAWRGVLARWLAG